VSTDEQTKNLSLELQRRECQAYCQRNGFAVDRLFQERGESAKTTDRPEFQAMLDYCSRNKGKIGAVVVYHTNRFARDARDHLNVTFTLGGPAFVCIVSRNGSKTRRPDALSRQ
jgi:DNA invertase Pin-like site-specific DNA recombinase